MKKIISILLASATALTVMGGLSACTGGEDTSKTITVWAPDAAIAGYQELANEFTSTYEDGKYKDYTVKFVAKEEGKVRDDLGTNPSGGADVYFFESGQFKDMVNNNLLQPFQGDYAVYAENVKARDTQSWIDVATKDDVIYAFPASADNTWFMWYDGDYFTDPNDLKTLDGMIAKAKADNKQIMLDYNNGWYNVSFFFAAGCYIDYDDQGKYKNDFGSDNGKKAVKAMVDYLSAENNTCADGQKKCLVVAGSNDAIPQGFKDETVVAGFMGTWIAKDMPEKAKATRTPTITIDGQQKAFRTFMAGKYCGVNPRRSNKEVAMALADFLTSEKGQQKRFEKTQSLPTNKVLAKSEAVTSSETAQAVLLQTVDGYNQDKHPDTMYKAMEAFGNNIANGTINKDNYASEAEKLQEDLEALS